VQIILEEFYHIQPDYQLGSVLSDDVQDAVAVMAIGDEALRLAGAGIYPYQYDLGDIWQQQTGMSFVFAVCAVREAFLQETAAQAAQAALIRQEFCLCSARGKENLAAICRQVAPIIPMDQDKCLRYMQGIEYDFKQDKQLALTKFFSLLIKRQQAAAQSLPLKIFS
jgi:chorismate dehydratase